MLTLFSWPDGNQTAAHGGFYIALSTHTVCCDKLVHKSLTVKAEWTMVKSY